MVTPSNWGSCGTWRNGSLMKVSIQLVEFEVQLHSSFRFKVDLWVQLEVQER